MKQTRGAGRMNTLAIGVFVIALMFAIGVGITGNSIFDWFFAEETEDAELEEGASEGFDEGSFDEDFEEGKNLGDEPRIGESNSEDRTCEPQGNSVCSANTVEKNIDSQIAIALATTKCNDKLKKCEGNLQKEFKPGRAKCNADTAMVTEQVYVGNGNWEPTKRKKKCQASTVRLHHPQLCREQGCELVKGGGACMYPPTCFDDNKRLIPGCQPTNCRKITADDPPSGTWICTVTGSQEGRYDCSVDDGKTTLIK